MLKLRTSPRLPLTASQRLQFYFTALPCKSDSPKPPPTELLDLFEINPLVKEKYNANQHNKYNTAHFFQQSESWVDYSDKYICIWIKTTPQHSNMSTSKVRLNVNYNELHENTRYSDFGLRFQNRVFRPLNQKVTADTRMKALLVFRK